VELTSKELERALTADDPDLRSDRRHRRLSRKFNMTDSAEFLKSHPVLLSDAERSGSIDAETLKRAFRLHPSGVAVVTADPTGDDPVAMTVSSLASVSTEPPLLVFSVSALSSAAPKFERSNTVVVHMVGADHLKLAQLGAASGIDRFADADAWRRLPTGEPVFTEVYAWLRGEIVFRLRAGNSTICVVHAIEANVPSSESTTPPAPLVYHARIWHRIGDRSSIQE
jgi:flavin reductase (DIM6/NTAB) family NADH-FMN oxidoreductase RutF